VRITFLLTDAYGSGATIRTTLVMASELAERHDVEVVSVVRHRDLPKMSIDPRIRLRVLTDDSPSARDRARASRSPVTQARRQADSALARVPSRLAHPDDLRHSTFSLRTDLALIRYVRSVSDGVLVGTRPALNLLIARHARPTVIAVGQEPRYLTRKATLRSAYTRLYPRLDAVVSLTRRDAADYRELLGAQARVEMMPRPAPDTGPWQAPAPTASTTVVAAGRLTRQKGFDQLVEAFALVHKVHPDWTLDIYGSGPEEAVLRARIDQHTLGDVIQLRGYTEQIHQRFAEAAIYAISSRSDGFPMMALEAMACGLPLVGFDCSTGAAEIIQNGRNGMLVYDGDIEALANTLVSLISDPQRRAAMGIASREMAPEYAPTVIADRWEELFEELERQPRRRHALSRRLLAHSPSKVWRRRLA
jgi:glycosyltransferase involved in cell wall biosynthesis